MLARPNAENRILVLAPFGKDSAHLCKVLSSEGFICVPVKDLHELTYEISQGAGLVLLTEEVLACEKSAILLEVLRNQPTWSAIPVIAFYSESNFHSALAVKASGPLQSDLGITFLQRPVSGMTLLSSVRAGLRDRLRQYRIRDLLQQLRSDLDTKTDDLKEQRLASSRSEEAKLAAIDANQAKSQFLANMSHEIRTPLGAILGFIDLMKDTSLTPSEASEYMSVIDRNSRHLLRLIDDILDLSKVEAGYMEIERVEFSLEELIFDFAALMRLRAQEKGIQFDFRLETAIPAKIISDPVRVRQVLTNVVGNAIKFTKRGSVELVCSFNEDILRFLVVDTGPGISKEQSKKLFRPFVQADSSTTRQFGGTGLGLVLTKSICERMGGTFKLTSSEPGKGSSFEASIKVGKVDGSPMFGSTKESAGPEHRIEVSNTGLDQMRILLIEDSYDNQMLVKVILKKLNAVIDIASNGAEGVERALSGSYHVVLMDLQMPVMDGHEATRILRESAYHVPIVALTAHAMSEERERTIASGFSDFLTKPINRDELLRVLLKYKP